MHKVAGILVDSLGKPLVGFKVRYINSLDTFICFSNTNGQYDFNNIKAGPFVLLVAQTDFVLFSGNYFIPTARIEMRFMETWFNCDAHLLG